MEATQGKEGQYLLGQPTFRELENGRLKCVETGHELPAHTKESYAQTKHCRLGLIDAALAANSPPLNMFSQDPASRSKLICKLTGDIVNKSEEHIWKHINGRRFLNLLEKKETEKQSQSGVVEPSAQKPRNKKLSKMKGKHKEKEEKENGAETHDASEKEDTEDFWMPEVGNRWDFDNGADRWASCSETESESESESKSGEEENEDENAIDDDVTSSEEKNKEEMLVISKSTKRMCIEIGPNNLASPPKKKKKKTTK